MIELIFNNNHMLNIVAQHNVLSSSMRRTTFPLRSIRSNGDIIFNFKFETSKTLQNFNNLYKYERFCLLFHNSHILNMLAKQIVMSRSIWQTTLPLKSIKSNGDIYFDFQCENAKTLKSFKNSYKYERLSSFFTTVIC